MDKLCPITGANSGIGRETSLALARLGYTVVMACRSRDKGEVALAEVRQKAGSNSVELMEVDLADLATVKKLAADYQASHPRLDVLVNNAGLILTKRTMTVDGFETTFQVNYLSHFLLTHLLLDELKSSAPSRIVSVSSSAHAPGHIHFDDLQCASGYSAFKSYGQSKLAQVLFTYELARRLNGTGVDVNCFHPGAVATNWGRNPGSWLSFGLRLFSAFEASPRKGAATSIYVASEPSLQGVTGKYFAHSRETKSSPESYDLDEAKRLWDVSLQLLGTKS